MSRRMCAQLSGWAALRGAVGGENVLLARVVAWSGGVRPVVVRNSGGIPPSATAAPVFPGQDAAASVFLLSCSRIRRDIAGFPEIRAPEPLLITC